MMSRLSVILGIVIALMVAGCNTTRHPTHVSNSHCADILAKLTIGAHRHNAGKQLTVLHRDKLLQEYHDAGCHQHLDNKVSSARVEETKTGFHYVPSLSS